MRTLLILLVACVSVSWSLTAREDADMRKKCATKVCGGVDRKDLRACLRQCYLEQHSLKVGGHKILPHIKSHHSKPHAKSNFEKQMDQNAAKLRAMLSGGAHNRKIGPVHSLKGINIPQRKK